MTRSPKAAVDGASRVEPIWGLLGVLAIAGVARAPRLMESLWYDEIAAYLSYSAKGPWYVISHYHDPSNHIFHSLLAWASVELLAWLGSIEFAFRLPALLFSLLSIVAMQALAREMASPRAGWIAALLMAILPVSVLEGADARGYSMMIFFSAASSWALLRGLREGKRGTWIAYAIFCALGVWSQLMTVFVPLGHGAMLLILIARDPHVRRRAGAAMLALAGGGLLAIFLYLPALDDMLRFYTQDHSFIAQSDQQPTLLGAEGLHLLLQLGGSWYWWAAIPGLLLVALGSTLSLREPRLRLALAATMLGLPLMLMIVALAGSWVYARFTLFAVPGGVLLMAVSIDWLSSRHRRIGIMAIAAIIIASAADLLIRPPRQPLRDAVELVLRQQSDSSPVIALGLNVPDIVIYEPRNFDLIFTRHDRDEFEQLIALPQVNHLIISYPHLLTAARIEAIGAAGFQRVANLPGWADWGRGEVLVFRRQ